MSKSMKATLTDLCQKEISTATDAELYTALLKLVMKRANSMSNLSAGENCIIFLLNF